MAYINICGTDIEYKDIPCKINGKAIDNYPSPHINIQVVLTNKCNANCKFCAYHTDRGKAFDVDKFLAGVTAINKRVLIPTVTFTGGEPSFELDVLKYCISYIQRLNSDIRIKVNTNGKNLESTAGLDIWQLSLSRHHLDDCINAKIFGVDIHEIPSLNDINALTEKQKNRLHISCNIIDGYVDSFDKMLSFIFKMGSLGIYDIGFVSLMGVTEWAKKRSIDFKNLNIKEGKNFVFGRHCEYVKDGQVCCECQVYNVLHNNGKVGIAYNRFARKNNSTEANLVYQIDTWKQGFSGPEIVLHT